MSISTTQLSLSQNTIDEIAQEALSFLRVLGLEADSPTSNRVGQDPVVSRSIRVGLTFGIEDLEPLVTWK